MFYLTFFFIESVYFIYGLARGRNPRENQSQQVKKKRGRIGNIDLKKYGGGV